MARKIREKATSRADLRELLKTPALCIVVVAGADDPCWLTNWDVSPRDKIIFGEEARPRLFAEYSSPW